MGDDEFQCNPDAQGQKRWSRVFPRRETRCLSCSPRAFIVHPATAFSCLYYVNITIEYSAYGGGTLDSLELCIFMGELRSAQQATTELAYGTCFRTGYNTK
jgi:hypothetical protein